MSQEFTAEQMRFIHAIQPDLMKIAALFGKVGLGVQFNWFRMPPPPKPPADVVPITKAKLKLVKE